MRRIYAMVIGAALAMAASLGTAALATADTTSGPITHQQAITYVMQRAISQRGVAYLYGGGNAAGPSRGTGLDANVVGFDASGLMQYAFAGVGIKLPRTSAQQYNAGRKIAPAQALPGDLLFFGPDGSESVAMYLGNGQMVEATDPAVTVSVVRTANMAPYLTRIIEWS